VARLLYVLVHSTDRPERAVAALRAAVAATTRGDEVALWLTGEGVRLGVAAVAETLREPGEPSAVDALGTLVGAGGVAWCVRRCFEERGFEADALREGALLADEARLGTLVDEGWIPVPT
jgi:predicted peroxiredoxin